MIARTEAPQHLDLHPADAAMSYWPTAQVPVTDPMLTTPPMGSLYYFPSQSYYGNRDLSSTKRRCYAAPVDQFQSISHTAYAESHAAAGYPDLSPSTSMTAPRAVTAIPAFAPLQTIAPHQSESGHNLMPQDVTTHSALCEVSTH